MKIKYMISLLIALAAILVLIMGFSIYEILSAKEVKEPVKEYTSEEIPEEETIVPAENAEIPTVEGGEEAEVLQEAVIMIKDMKFVPSQITISPGTTVTWFNQDNAAHKVVAYDRLFYGQRLVHGDKYSFTFTQEGTHKYFDANFPKILRGTIIVKEEPLPITGGAVGVDLNRNGSDGMFALLILLFAIMMMGLSHGMYTHYKK